jgi:hypothetical protein
VSATASFKNDRIKVSPVFKSLEFLRRWHSKFVNEFHFLWGVFNFRVYHLIKTLWERELRHGKYVPTEREGNVFLFQGREGLCRH